MCTRRRQAGNPFIPRYLEVHLVKKAWNEAQATRTQRLTGVSWSSAWLGLDGTDAEESPQPGRVTMFPYRPAKFVEFDITDAMKSWRNGVANNGLVIRATNELERGRSIRFASNGMSDSSKHAYVLVRCASEDRKSYVFPPSNTIPTVRHRQVCGRCWSIHQKSWISIVFILGVLVGSVSGFE